jgi:N-acetylneuraminic acid mutarotase
MLNKQGSHKVSKVQRRRKSIGVLMRLQWLKVVRRWRKLDRRFGLLWRVGNGAAAVVMIVAVFIPVLQQISNSASYHLSAEALQLVGATDPTLEKQLTYDARTSTYQFNANAVKSNTSSNPITAMQAQTGTASGQGKDKSLYALDVPTDFSKGVTYHDINSQLSFSLVPQFKAAEGKTTEGHVVFPLSGDNQAIYTLKNNGLKEDIVVPNATSDSMTFGYKLDLPGTLEVKVIPDSNGAIGVYSADPTLFGNISYGSDSDRATVEKARTQGAKTNLVFGLPSPVIKNASGQEVGSARFVLNGDHLSVVATGLNAAHGPVTIDPSVVVTSTSDFQTNGNNEDNIDFSTADQVKRASLTGGSVTVSGWTSTTAFTTARGAANTIAYNGYLYVLGGNGSSVFSDVQYAPINASTGAVGSWTATTSFPTARYAFTSFVYNGYLYVLGGFDNTNAALSDVQYAPINSNGTVGSWTSTTSFTTARDNFAATVYDGYAYVIGGKNNSGTQLNDVQYAPINSNGTVGSWTSTTSFTTARSSLNAVVYNGYLYMMGGYDGSVTYNDVQYAPINSNGTVGSWTSTTSFTTARSDFSAMISGGYLYVIAGYAGGDLGDVQYAPINSNGTVGKWATTTALSPTRLDAAVTSYNGYLYVVGGYTGVSTAITTVLYAKVDPAGQIQAWPAADTAHSLSANRALNCLVAYNGYLYSIGGSTSGDNANNVTTVQSSLIAADGTIGNWSTLTVLPAGRGSAGCAASNGFLYVVGGYTGAGSMDGAVLYDSIGSSGTIGGSWTTSTTDPTHINANFKPVHNGVFAYGNNLYSIGGEFSSGSGTGHNTGTSYAPINSDGSLGTWVSGSSLTGNYSARAYALVGNYLYAMGGVISSSGTAQNAVEYVVINSNGTLGTWATTTSLPGVISDGGGATVNGCLYSVGGETGAGTSLKTVYGACPNANGTISSWQTLPILPTATTDSGVAGYNGFLYSVAGWTTTAIKSTEWTPVNNGGSGVTGTWTTSGNTMTNSREGVASVVSNGYMYVLGGSNGTTYTNTVEYAAINANGSVGTWNSGSTMLLGRRYAGAVVSNGYMYILGGDVGSPGTVTVSKETEVAAINSNGSLGTWATTTQMPTAMYQFGATMYNGYVYIAGGNPGGASSAVSYAALSSSGIGTWQTGTSLATARFGDAAIAYGGNLYVIGGSTAAPALLNDVQYAPLNASTGAVGSWTFATSIPARRFPSVTAANGHLYLMGGTDTGANSKNDVLIASISSNGALGNWMTTGSFTTTRFGAGSAYYNGYLYEIAGRSGASTYKNDVEYAPLTSIPRVAHYSKLIDLGSQSTVSSITYNGTLAGGTAAIAYKGALGSGAFTLSGTANNITTTGTCSGSLAGMRYVWVFITLDDSTGNGGNGGVFADGTGTNANLTDFTVNYSSYHPSPNIRMRNGLTMQSGTLGALDTCLP